MASTPTHRLTVGSRSGGKIVRARQPRSRRTPYERPRLSNLGPGENPSWISRFIFSPTRTIASGAGKLLYSAFVSESESSSSSSDSDSDDVEDNIGDETHNFQGTEEVKKNVASKTMNLFRKDFQQEMKETKRLIEQLLMQVTFSRAERDKLFQIIDSRVIDSQTIEAEAEGRLAEIAKRTVNADDGRLAICGTAIVEAKKWLHEKRLGSSAKSEMDCGPSTLKLNSKMSPLVIDEEMGSPVDVAKSYMRERPPWASPSANTFEFKSPSPLGLQLFKEETSYSIAGNALSSSKIKRESSASGSWNIQEELRRVRSKATEEMLRKLPSSKLDWSSSASEHKSNRNSLGADNLKIYNEDKLQDATKSLDQPLILSSDNVVNDNLLGSKMMQEVSENGMCLFNTASVILLEDKDLEANPAIERKVENTNLDDTDRECSTVNEAMGLANGFSLTVPSSSLSGEHTVGVEQNHVDNDNITKTVNPSDHTHETTQGVDPCELSSEASIEVHGVNDVDIGTVSTNEKDTEKATSEKNDTGNADSVVKSKAKTQNSVANKSTGTPNTRRGRRRN